MSGTDGEYNISSLKTELKSNIDDILYYLSNEFGDKATIFIIANTLLHHITAASYVEVTVDGDDGVTIYRETDNLK
jgi:hypothetical protein